MPDGIQSSPVIADAATGLIFQKMPAILAEIGHIGKDKTNVQQKFNYRGIDDVYLAIHGLLAKHKVFVTAKILGKSREERRTQRDNGSMSVLAFTCLTMRFRFYAEDASFVDTEAEGEGMDSGDKSSNKAMSVAQKYAFIQAFCIPTEGIADPDADSHSVEPRPDPAEMIRQQVAAAVNWIGEQTDAQAIHAKHSATMDWFLNLPQAAQEHINKAREAQLRKIAPPQTDAPQSDDDQKEAWVNKHIPWINTQTSAEAVAQFWTTNAALIKGLKPYQLAPLEKAKNAAKARLTGIQGPTASNKPPINLDDEINF